MNTPLILFKTRWALVLDFLLGDAIFSVCRIHKGEEGKNGPISIISTFFFLFLQRDIFALSFQEADIKTTTAFVLC